MIKKNTIPIIILAAVLLVTSAYAYSHKKYSYFCSKAIKEYKKIKRNPGSWLILGLSEKGNPIFYREFGSGNNVTLIIGGIHGDEPAATVSVIELARFLQRNPSAISEKTVLVASINPDGLLSATRTNSRGVDLNRNFPADNWSAEFVKSYNNPGKKPASEIETRLASEIIEKYKPRLLIHMHQPFNTLYANKYVPVSLTAEMSKITGLPVKEDVWYPTPGSMGSYAISGKKRIPVITYEMGPIDRQPNYSSVVVSLVTAINSMGDRKK